MELVSNWEGLSRSGDAYLVLGRPGWRSGKQLGGLASTGESCREQLEAWVELVSNWEACIVLGRAAYNWEVFETGK